MTTRHPDTIGQHFVARRFSRRQAMSYGATGFAASTLTIAGLVQVASAQDAEATPVAADDLMAAIDAIMAAPQYRSARLGLHVADRATGETVFDIRGDEWFLAASTTKLFSGAAALDAYGPDYRFETPVYRTGSIAADGELAGDLILVASGDLTMGGRDTEDGQIAFTPMDHINATAFPDLVELTPRDPLAGLEDLARQVAAAGVRHVNGEVIVDDRLFPMMEKDGYLLTPIWINDNLIDFIITPGEVGEAATLEWRPMSAAYQVEVDVNTVAASAALDISVSSPAPGQILVAGQIPVDQSQAVPTYQVENPSAFARTLLIEALERAGVTVAASPTGANPVDLLPAPGDYTESDQVALHRSLPFSENLKLIEKTSHNQHADMLIFLLALSQGNTTYEEGMLEVRAIVEQAGIVSALVSLSDGRGNEYTDLFSPRTVARLLAYMATRSDFPAYFDALPILGVDGTEAATVESTSLVAGKAAAKSGMTIAFDLMNQRPVVMTRALAGYLTGQSGRELIFALYLNNVPLSSLEEIISVIHEQGAIVEEIFTRV
ncbi:MAG: D-alanyl-D-alanine carboxypeptidase/D-alanyl-D-alanine endopeptidase [Thermomicrobiales bacterium]